MYTESNQPQKNHREPSSAPELRRCANCEIEFLWPPTVVQGKVYCCTGCASGGPCSCDYSQYYAVNIAGVIHYGPETRKGRTDLQADQEKKQ